MPNLTYNDVLSAYAHYPAPIRPFLLRTETHPTLRMKLTKSFMRIMVDIVARAPIADPTRALIFRADVIANDLDVTTKTVSRAVSLFRQLGWLTRYPGTDRRNNWGEFCAGEFLLSDELRTMLGLPTTFTTESQPTGTASMVVEQHPALPNPNENQQLGSVEIHTAVPKKEEENSPNETEMSPGHIRVNKVCKQEASFSTEAFDSKPEKATPKTNPVSIPADLRDFHTELQIDLRGICKLMQLAKSTKQRLQDIWIAKRDQLLNSGAKQGRAFNYVKFLLQCGEDFSFVARQKRSTSNMEIKPACVPIQASHAYSNKTFVSAATGFTVTVQEDGSGLVSDGSRINAYVRPADMTPIFEAIIAGRLSANEASNDSLPD